MTTHIKLYGAKAARFEAIKADVGSRQGFEPTNPEVIGYLMAAYQTEPLHSGGPSPVADRSPVRR